MNTGADDDSLSTPTFAFNASSARAIPPAVIANTRAKANRANPVIPFPPRILEPFGHLLAAADEGARLLQYLLQLFHRNVARNRIARQRQRRSAACRLAHGKAGAGNSCRRLAVMGHRGAAAGHQE